MKILTANLEEAGWKLAEWLPYMQTYERGKNGDRARETLTISVHDGMALSSVASKEKNWKKILFANLGTIEHYIFYKDLNRGLTTIEAHTTAKGLQRALKDIGENGGYEILESSQVKEKRS